MRRVRLLIGTQAFFMWLVWPRGLLCLVLAILSSDVVGGTPGRVGWIQSQTIFQSGRDGYHTYRIPALLVTSKGSVLAFCEGRKTGAADHGDVDLLMKRSTDGGRTWSAQRIVHEEGGDAEVTIGNPCPVVDERTGVVWLPFTRDNKAVFITSSADDGQTWAAPRNISAETMKPDWNWVATGPGVGIRLTRGPYKGRLIIPSDHSRSVAGGGTEWNSHMMFSDDGGRSWQISAPIQTGGNECQVIERVDGSLLVNTRMQGDFHGFRGIATSTDGGMTWSVISQETQLPCPKCQGSLIRCAWPDANSPGRLLFGNPNPNVDVGKKSRANLTVRISTDDGRTWPVARLLHDGPAAYSSLARLPDGTVLCLYEGADRGSGSLYDSIRLARFDLEWLTGTRGFERRLDAASAPAGQDLSRTVQDTGPADSASAMRQ
jgi:sialidase-1